MNTPPAILVFTTMPDQDAARDLAHGLLEAHLAACVSVLSPCRSYYRWQDSLNEDGEVPVIIKTVAGNYDRLETFMRARHPYELPELVAVDITRGLPDYLAWVAAETLEKE